MKDHDFNRKPVNTANGLSDWKVNDLNCWFEVDVVKKIILSCIYVWEF